MNILMISADNKLFEKGSAVQQRMFKYGKLCDQLIIIVFTKRGFAKIQLAKNIWLYPTNSYDKLFFICDAYKIVKKEILRGVYTERSECAQNDAGKSVQSDNYFLKHARQSFSKRWLITTQDPFEAGVVGYLTKKRFKIPWQVQIHTDFLNQYFWQESFKNKIRVILAKWLLPRADSIRVVSDRIKNSLINKLRISNDNILVIPIYVDAEKIKNESPKFNLRQKYSNFDHIILTVGRLAKEKNHKLLLDGFSVFVKKYSKSLLVIVGDGSERKNLEAQIKSLDLTNNVVIEGWQDDLVSYYKGADLFVFNSKYEGYGMAVIEAMTAGLPVLMTDVGCAYDLPSDMRLGVEDKDVLAKMMENGLTRDEVRWRLLLFGQNMVKNLPSEEELLMLHKKSWEDSKFF